MSERGRRCLAWGQSEGQQAEETEQIILLDAAVHSSVNTSLWSPVFSSLLNLYCSLPWNMSHDQDYKTFHTDQYLRRTIFIQTHTHTHTHASLEQSDSGHACAQVFDMCDRLLPRCLPALFLLVTVKSRQRHSLLTLRSNNIAHSII